MKKILLIIAVVLCLAVAGTALAVTYNSSDPVTGDLKANSYLKLSLDSCSTADITINPGTPVVYTIQCDVTSIQENEVSPKTGTLTITLADAGAGQDLDDVTVALFTDAACTAAVAGKTQTGAGAITVTDISATTTYYAKISVPSALDEAGCEACGGTMTLSFAKAA